MSGNGHLQARRLVEAVIVSAGYSGQVVVDGVESRKKHFFVRVRVVQTGAETTLMTSRSPRAGRRMTDGPADGLRLKRLIEERLA